MIALHFVGRPPPSALVRALEGLGASVFRGSRAASGALVVSAAESPGAPASVPEGSAWVWLPKAAVSVRMAVQAIRAGAYDVVPVSAPDAADRLVARAAELAVVDPEPPAAPGFVATSDVAHRVLKDLRRAARTSMPVLLTGETGTGKELAARLVHAWSARASRRFVPINCAAIPNDLIEAELFGYARGAFSGAVRAYDGQIMAAEGGTVLLDEIDDTPPTLQTKLLRVLEDRVVTRLGENEWHRVDFRIVAATNRDLGKLIDDGSFGKDLYERLAIVRVDLPGLRERISDLPPLVSHFIDRFYVEEPGRNGEGRVLTVSGDALGALAEYPWPGNVRELRNVVYEALVGKTRGTELLLSDLPRRILFPGAKTSPDALVDREKVRARVAAGTLNLRRELELLERIALEEALRMSGGAAAGAAKRLGEVGRGAAKDPAGTVRAMMRRLGVTS